MAIEELTASQREQLKVTVLEDVLGHEPSWGVKYVKQTIL